jgi:hypothetical protein
MKTIASYHDHLADLSRDLAERGSLGVIVMDGSPIGAIESEYGGDAFEEVRQRITTILLEQQGKDYRNDDVLALDRPRGLRYLLLLGRKRRRSIPTVPTDL